MSFQPVLVTEFQSKLGQRIDDDCLKKRAFERKRIIKPWLSLAVHTYYGCVSDRTGALRTAYQLSAQECNRMMGRKTTSPVAERSRGLPRAVWNRWLTCGSAMDAVLPYVVKQRGSLAKYCASAYIHTRSMLKIG